MIIFGGQINRDWYRNNKMCHAVAAIPPVLYLARRQAIRVIRKKMDSFEWALADHLPR